MHLNQMDNTHVADREFGNATAHELFSIMLQKRVDSELPDLHMKLQQLEDVMVAQKRMVIDLDVRQRMSLMRRVLLDYAEYSSPQNHYTAVLLSDLESVFAEYRGIAASAEGSNPKVTAETRPSHAGLSTADEIAKPFLARTRPPYVENIRKIAHIIADAPYTDLVAWWCMQDMPELVSDVDDDHDDVDDDAGGI